jgi:hypothetical protein
MPAQFSIDPLIHLGKSANAKVTTPFGHLFAKQGFASVMADFPGASWCQHLRTGKHVIVSRRG